jgi:hypothetical protein
MVGAVSLRSVGRDVLDAQLGNHLPVVGVVVVRAQRHGEVLHALTASTEPSSPHIHAKVTDIFEMPDIVAVHLW